MNCAYSNSPGVFIIVGTGRAFLKCSTYKMYICVVYVILPSVIALCKPCVIVAVLSPQLNSSIHIHSRTTSTFITEVLRLVTQAQLLLTTVTVN